LWGGKKSNARVSNSCKIALILFVAIINCLNFGISSFSIVFCSLSFMRISFIFSISASSFSSTFFLSFLESSTNLTIRNPMKNITIVDPTNHVSSCPSKNFSNSVAIMLPNIPKTIPIMKYPASIWKFAKSLCYPSKYSAFFIWSSKSLSVTVSSSVIFILNLILLEFLQVR